MTHMHHQMPPGQLHGRGLGHGHGGQHGHGQRYRTTAQGANTRGSFPGQKLATDLVYQMGFSVTPLAQRPPSRREAMVLRGLQTSLTTHFDEEVHHGHLERIWELVFRDESGHAPAFQRYSIAWCAIGFQQRDPSADVRGGGELSLDFMLYLLEQQRPLVERILRAHKRRTLQRGQYANYPFACAAIGITRKLAEVFQIVQPHLGPTDEYEVALKHFYPCVQSKQTFMELACATFSLLDHKWDVEEASYMDFNRIMAETITALVDNLSRLPVGVTPSAHSFTPPEADDYMSLNVGEDEALGAGTLAGVGAGLLRRPPLVRYIETLEEEEEEGGEELETGTDASSASEDEDEDEDEGDDGMPSSRVRMAFEDARSGSNEEEEEEEPLLDLQQFEECELPVARHTGMGIGRRACFVAPGADMDFFESFGVPE
mmetsp:Transcript_25806/g.60324  ORF Transcript_25806/g.60324 Transcript_25806/m.60324 type:complete len:430 (+) Transcript_25806:110-1399(+)|eukprot:CAMPEP_0182599662 /NCGR_PEP_ID=MMETSP1324-20130603/90591_1 /TAXON_ID=236786 /ORGANISM="Florenciella sp., Strain RCC1587" /LENGTH=429 /DNA_ID=CAMNT_0024817563 /DNA_START=104 /DNA_END=1393 /DNA_ORIENTATION=+